MLNAVSMFGKILDWNSGATYALTIIAIIILFAGIVGVLYSLIRALKEQEQIPVTEEVVNEEAAPAEAPAEPQPQSPIQIIVIQNPQPEPQPQPEPVVVQQPVIVETATTKRIDEDEDEDEEEEELIEEESYPGSIVRYNRSFTAKYIQSPDDKKTYYVHLKNELLSYKKVKGRMSWKRESFHCGREQFARFAYRGKTLCIYLPLDPADFVETKYHVEDAKDIAMYEDTPCMYRIKNERRMQYACELIEMVAEKFGTEKMDPPHSEDYYLPYEGLVQLIDRGLVKRVIRQKVKDFITQENQNPTDKKS